MVVNYILINRSAVRSGFLSLESRPVGHFYDAASFHSYDLEPVGSPAMKSLSQRREGAWLRFSSLSPIFVLKWQRSEEG